MQPGLHLEQAPPIAVPFRFFLTAPLALVGAAAVLTWRGPEAFDTRASPAALAVSHLITLGFMAMVMVGAMMQMLPVLAGAPIPRVLLIGGVTHLGLALGTLALAAGFLFAQPVLIQCAVIALAAGFGAFLAGVAASLARAGTVNATVGGMALAVLSLAVTVGLGLTLAGAHGWGVPLANLALRDLHPGWGLLGWTGLLVAGVAYQVVPMFQMTPPYPRAMTRWFPPAVFIGLTAWSVAAWMGGAEWTRAALLLALLLAVAYVLFAGVTLGLQHRRRRRQSDVTLDFWRLGMASAIAAATLWGVRLALPALASDAVDLTVGVLVLAGFAVSVINGMLYKIAPFLTWFHLQAVWRGPSAPPHMKKILAEHPQRVQLRVHIAAVALLAGAPWWPGVLVYPAAAALALSALLLWRNLRSAETVLKIQLALNAALPISPQKQKNQGFAGDTPEA